MIICFLLSSLISVTHAPGWSDPVISIEVPSSYQRKDLVVTDGNHVHQIWDHFEDDTRIGYNIILPDGTVLLADTMLSRDVWSAYPSMSDASNTSTIAFWRENNPIWYAVVDHDGNTLIPPTMYTAEGWLMWPTVDSSPDSLGRVHMVWNLSDGSVCYSVLDPGIGEVFRDTIPDSMMGCLVLVDGPRVHIKFNGLDQLADYIQYDLQGNVTIPTVNLVEDLISNSNSCSMSTDYAGNVFVFVKGSPAGGPYRFCLYKLDRSTGEVLIDGLILYTATPGNTIIYPHILARRPAKDQFYLMWVEDDPILQDLRWIKFAIIDTDGNFIEEPYIAYDYTDEDPEDIRRLAATTNEVGDVFAIWSEGDITIPGYWIRLGWFDHNWVGIEDETSSVNPQTITLNLSSNPFTDFLSIQLTGSPQVLELLIYDITGRQVISLGSSDGNIFHWDGRDREGNQLPSGAYIIRAEVQGLNTTVKVVKLD